ncbi:unnamed protein product, partial [Ectocarpus sp. 4 AP-2014]
MSILIPPKLSFLSGLFCFSFSVDTAQSYLPRSTLPKSNMSTCPQKQEVASSGAPPCHRPTFLSQLLRKKAFPAPAMLKSLITLARIDIEAPVRVRQKGTRGGRLSRRAICARERNQLLSIQYCSLGGVGLLAQHLCKAGKTATMEVSVVVPWTQQSYLHH